MVHKLSCPTFDGSNPRIWKSKCLDYFQLCNIDEAFWTTAASLSMDGNAAKWLQVYKKKYGLGDWESFIAAVEKKFGAHDYRDAISKLLELKQTTSVEEYAIAFENLQFEICMHNDGFDDMFFVSQFIQGLKSDISAGVRPKCQRMWMKLKCWLKYSNNCWKKENISGLNHPLPVSFTLVLKKVKVNQLGNPLLCGRKGKH